MERVIATSSQSPFLKWFIEQHGEREHTEDTDKQLLEKIWIGEKAREELESRRTWSEKQTSALYAWIARNKEEP